MTAVGVDYGPAPDFWISQALREIKSSYGHNASVAAKLKSLTKFGRSSNADQNIKTTVMDLPGAEANETFVTTNLIDSMSSSDAGDDQTMVIEGHTIDANGLLTFVVQEKDLDGQNEVTLDTPLARSTRAYVKSGTFASPATDLAGVVYVYDNTGTTPVAGVPDIDAQVHLMVRGDQGRNQSEKCATSLSQYDYWLIAECHCAVSRGGAGTVNVDFEIEYKPLGGVWRPAGMEVTCRAAANPFQHIQFNPMVIIPPNSDVRMVAISNTNNTAVAGRIEGVMAKIIGA